LLDQEYVRRTSNSNTMLKHKIENLRVVIQELMDSYENIKRCNQIKQNENDALTLEVE
jgi:hypothetical protein